MRWIFLELSKIKNIVATLIEILFEEVSPIPIKQALNILGFNCGKPRYPLVECSTELKEELNLEINKY